MVGGRSQEDLDAGLTLNRAFQSHRQPGSSIKPLVVYTPAFERGYYPGTLVEDKEIEDGPENSGGGYMGELELSEAVQRSLNTVAWQIYDDISPRYGLSKLKGMHFSMIVDSDNTLATSLGGFTYGVEPVEMASGYATLFNDGKYRIPSCITSIEDYQGTTVYSYNGTSSKIYDKNAAREMVSVMQGVLEEGWGTGRGLRLNNGMPAAGKTGTTDDTKDGWFCGFTHYYTTAVWVGCDTPEPVRGLQGASWPGQIWKNFMNLIHEELEPVEFKDYDRAKEKRALKDQDYHDDYDDDDDQPKKKATTADTAKTADKEKDKKPVEPKPSKPENEDPTPSDDGGETATTPAATIPAAATTPAVTIPAAARTPAVTIPAAARIPAVTIPAAVRTPAVTIPAARRPPKAEQIKEQDLHFETLRHLSGAFCVFFVKCIYKSIFGRG